MRLILESTAKGHPTAPDAPERLTRGLAELLAQAGHAGAAAALLEHVDTLAKGHAHGHAFTGDGEVKALSELRAHVTAVQARAAAELPARVAKAIRRELAST